MSAFFSLSSSAWLLQGVTIPDTTVAKVVMDRSWWQVLIAIEQALVPLFLLALLAALVLFVGKVVKAIQEVQRLLQSSSGDITQAAHSVRKVAESVQSMSDNVRKDVEQVGDTIRSVNARVRSAADRVEHRLERFDALIDVAQEEAEDFVLSTAATLRGVRRGAKVLRRSLFHVRGNGAARARRRRWREREDELDEAMREDEERPRIRTSVPDER